MKQIQKADQIGVFNEFLRSMLSSMYLCSHGRFFIALVKTHRQTGCDRDIQHIWNFKPFHKYYVSVEVCLLIC